MSTDTLFSTLADAMSDLDGAFGRHSLAKDIKAAADEIQETTLEQVPANIWKDEDGTMTIEVAVPGKTKENVKVSLVVLHGKNYIQVNVNAPQPSEEEIAAKKNRKYTMRKIRGMESLGFKVSIEENLDVNALKAKVENGLLRITIPQKPEAKPLQFVID